ncbi:hypothetical protein ACWCSD_52995, partial [Nonomuraea sp. NPDC001684]
ERLVRVPHAQRRHLLLFHELRRAGKPVMEREPFAVTDMGNVSHVVPAVHPMLDIGAGGAAPHEPGFAAAAAAPAADRALVEAAVLLALTTADLALTP